MMHQELERLVKRDHWRPVGALMRAKADAESGDVGSARRRLLSVIGSCGYNAEVCETIARYSATMGDLTEAGRWYFLCDSSDEQAGACMERFVASCGGNPASVIAQFPRLQRATKQFEKLDAFPPAVAQRLASLHVPLAAPRRRRAQRSSISGKLLGLGCLLILILGVACAAIGAATIVGWVRTGI